MIPKKSGHFMFTGRWQQVTGLEDWWIHDGTVEVEAIKRADGKIEIWCDEGYMFDLTGVFEPLAAHEATLRLCLDSQPMKGSN